MWMIQLLNYNDLLLIYQGKSYNGRIFQLEGIIIQDFHSNSWSNIGILSMVQLEEGHVSTARKVSDNQEDSISP